MTKHETTARVERNTGVALWRQIADMIRSQISDPAPAGSRIPPETELAMRYGVNRHTVRAAIAALVQEGVLRSEQGRGTFVQKRKRLTYPIARRTRFSAGLEGQATEFRSKLLGNGTEPANELVAAALGIAAGAPVVRLETTSSADDTPVSRTTSWFDGTRFPAIVDALEISGSVTKALSACGVSDYVRQSTYVAARHASPEDLEVMGLSPGAIVLVTRAVDADLEGRPIHYLETRFAADRIELRMDTGSATP